MGAFSFKNQPPLSLLSQEEVLTIHQQALHILERTGVKFYSQEALKILKEHGVKVDFQERLAKFPKELVEEAIKKVPKSLKLYNGEGEEILEISGNRVHFNPGSAAIKFMESDGETVRSSKALDLIKIIKVTEALEHIAIQSSAVVLFDVPKLIGDTFRLYLLLKYSTKPILTGAFSIKGITHMKDLLTAIAGGEEELATKPMAIFDVCPSPPLKWTEISAKNIIDCAYYGLPIETISMPMPGAASPVTLAGSVLLHTAETLSGIVLAQAVNPGTPMIYGGAPVNFHMRLGTTPMGAIEATMIGAAYGQLGKYYGIPTHTYACLSDSKVIDVQAGLETAMSGVVAQLAGINIISGPGILDFVGCISLEKLLIDNEICGLALRLNKGIDCSQESLAVDLIHRLGPGGDYLSTEHTLKHFQEESYEPSPIIDRHDRSTWEAKGKKTAFQQAREMLEEILKKEQPPLCQEKERALDDVMKRIMQEEGIKEVPYGPTIS